MIWVIVGCIIPDLPWISLKLILLLEIFNPYDLRLYFTAQASLLFCLFFAAGLSLFLLHSQKIFWILAANCSIHLLLDALQIKWGNGVHLVAPFDWSMYQIGLLGPENILIAAFSLAGLVYLIVQWKPIVQSLSNGASIFDVSNHYKICTGFILLVTYLLAPLLCMPAMEKADTYYIKTMKERSLRPGKAIEFDRARYSATVQEIRLYSGEKLNIVGKQPQESGRVSFRGTFLSPDTVQTTEYHYHHDYRDLASVVGLFLTCTLLLQSLVLSRLRR